MACGYRLGYFLRSFASIAMRPNSMPILPGREAVRSPTLDCAPSPFPAAEHYVLKRGRTVYILVVDDSQFTTALVQFALKQEGYEVEVTDNPRGAMQMIQKREPDLLILDIAMPYQSGFEFTARLRAEGYDIPLIFMTAQDSMESKLKGFHIGADDYICKPFDHQELVARVHAVLRRIKRSKRSEGQSIRVGPIELFPAELQVVINDRVKVPLTRTEMQVLRVLMSCPDQVVSRDQLLSSVWNDNENNSNIVDVYT
ncbi:response regulator transcription factor, partial [Thermogemmatispora sp.]|uniref:response regulator transcription factor n=1 Tax=Thermogemmatispora sp. TaxID=1968838 RepID=UPI002ACC1619